jgi:hypothetical protein
MELIEQEIFNKDIEKSDEHKFTVDQNGLYLIEIIASAKDWKQNLIATNFISFFRDDNLIVKIDDIEFPKLNGKKGLFDGEIAWNGNNLKGLSKTNVFALLLKKGEHTLFFESKQKPTLKSIKISLVESKEKITYIPTENNQAEDGNRRQWISFALVNIKVNKLNIQARANTHKSEDDDDLKLIINGDIQKNNTDKAHKYWYWCGRVLNGKEKTFNKDLDPTNKKLYIELWADRRPHVRKIEIEFIEQLEESSSLPEVSAKTYAYTGVRGGQDYNRYDRQIEYWTNHWNQLFLNDKYPVEEPLDPSLVKAICYQESKLGYYPGGEIDIMQVGDTGDPAIHILNNDGAIRLPNGEPAVEYEIKDGKEWLVDYDGEAKVETIDDSLEWGIRWLYHVAQGITADGKRYWRPWKEAVFRYGPNTDEYTENVWNIYKNGLDKPKTGTIKLWSVLLLLVIVSLSWLYSNQGKVYLKDIELGEKYIWTGRAQLEIGILDGLRIKKAVIGPIKNKELASHGIIRDSVMVEYYDIDNDGQDEVLISAKNFIDRREIHFFEIGKKKLEPIRVREELDIGLAGDNKLIAEDIFFGGVNEQGVNLFGTRDKQGRHQFITMSDVIDYDSGNRRVYQRYYRFNKAGEIEFYKRNTEEILAMSD